MSIATCRTFMARKIAIEGAHTLHEICKREDVTARAAILKRFKETGIPGTADTVEREYADVEVAVLKPETMIHIAQIYHGMTASILLYEEWRPKE